MKIKVILTLLSAALALYSCSDNSVSQGNIIQVDTSSFVFPFDIGNYWDYASNSTVTDIKPDSLRRYFTNYPLTGTGRLQITKDTLLNGVTVRQFTNTYSENSITFISRIYYIQNDTALIQYAYSLSSASEIFPDNKHKLFYTFKGKTFRSIRELLFTAEYELNSSGGDTLIYENPAPMALVYPVRTNREWIYRNFESSVLTRKYLNYENLNIGNISESCMKTEFKWSTINNLESYDHYSRHGKLRHYLFLNDMIVTDEFGHTLGTIDMKDISLVSSYFVQEIMP